MNQMPWTLNCVECDQIYAGDAYRYRCQCGGTLEVTHRFEESPSLATFDERLGSRDALDRSGVWRFRELILPLPERFVCTRGEGNTHLYWSDRVAAFAGLDHFGLKHEGENPTGSF